MVHTSSIRESLHASLVILLRLNVVHTDRVGANRLHKLSVEPALGRIDERVIGNKLVRDAYRIH